MFIPPYSPQATSTAFRKRITRKRTHHVTVLIAVSWQASLGSWDLLKIQHCVWRGAADAIRPTDRPTDTRNITRRGFSPTIGRLLRLGGLRIENKCSGFPPVSMNSSSCAEEVYFFSPSWDRPATFISDKLHLHSAQSVIISTPPR